MSFCHLPSLYNTMLVDDVLVCVIHGLLHVLGLDNIMFCGI